MNTKTHVYKGLVFSVEVEADKDLGAPWIENDCHGTVRVERKHYKKRPGEMIMHSTLDYIWVYEFQSACRIARTIWGCSSKRVAAEAAYRDFLFLQGYIRGDWYYQIVSVSLLLDGEPIAVSTVSLGGVESCSSSEHLEEILDDLCEESLRNAKSIADLLNAALAKEDSHD